MFKMKKYVIKYLKDFIKTFKETGLYKIIGESIAVTWHTLLIICIHLVEVKALYDNTTLSP